MKVYIQRFGPDFQDDWLFLADMGFKKLGADIRYFEEMETVPFSKDIVVVGFIEDTIKYFNDHEIVVPKPLNIPIELNKPEWLGRKVDFMTMEKFRRTRSLPVFIKPHSQVKSFSSGVLTSESTERLVLGSVPADDMVMTSDIMDFVSEYRCFVYNKQLVGIKHYTGDFRIFPGIVPIDYMINKYTLAPVAYTMDVGVTLSGTTRLIECNDFWSIGSYGLDAVLYAKMLRDRWFQIIR